MKTGVTSGTTFRSRHWKFDWFGKGTAENTSFRKLVAPIGAARFSPMIRWIGIRNRPESKARAHLLLRFPDSFGFRNQLPLPRRLVPNAFAGACLQGHLPRGRRWKFYRTRELSLWQEWRLVSGP